MRGKAKGLMAILMSILMMTPLIYFGDPIANAEESDLKFTKLQVVEGTTVVADLLNGEVPKLQAGKDYAFVVDYKIPTDLQFSATYLDVELGSGLYFTSFPGAKFEAGAIVSTGFEEFTAVPSGNAEAPYGYPGNSADGKGNLKNRTGKAEFKTKKSLLAVSSKNEIAFRVDDAFESNDATQIFNNAIKFSLRTDNNSNLDPKVSNVNAIDTPRYSLEKGQGTDVVSKGGTTKNLSVSASTGSFLTEAGSKTTIQIVYPKDVIFEKLEESNVYKTAGVMGTTTDDGVNKTTTVTFDEKGRLIGGLNFKPYFTVPANSGLTNGSTFNVKLKNLKVDVWKDTPDGIRDSSNEVDLTIRVIDGDSPEEVTRIALTDTMTNWSKDKYDTYNVRLGSMLIKNEIPLATSPKTLELKIDKDDTAIIRGVTIPYWKDINYGSISWTSKSGKSGVLTDFTKLEKGSEAALIKNTALGLDINDSIKSIKVDLGEIPASYIGTEYVDQNLIEAIKPAKKNNATTTWQAFYHWGYYPVGIWGSWQKGKSADVITEAKLFKTGAAATDDESYNLVGKSDAPIVTGGGYGKISKNQVNGSDSSNNSFHIKGNIGSSDWDYTPLQEPVIYIIMPEGFQYSNLTLSGGTLSKPDYVGEFDHGSTKVKVWKYIVDFPTKTATNGQYQPDFSDTKMELNMDVVVDGTAKVATYHINDFVGITTKDFKAIKAKIRNLRWQASNWKTDKYTDTFGEKVNYGMTMASIAERVGVEVKQAAEVSAQSKLIVPAEKAGEEPKTYVYDNTSDETKKDTTAVLAKGDTAIQRIYVRNTVPITYETNPDGSVKKDGEGKPIIKSNSTANIDLYVPLMTKNSDFGPSFTPEGELKLPLTLKGITTSKNFTIKYLKIKAGKTYELNKKPDDADYEVVTNPSEANMILLSSTTALKYGDGGIIDIEYEAGDNLNSKYNKLVNIVTPVLDYDLDGNRSTLTKEPAAISFFIDMINIEGKKIWDDKDNQDGIRPEKVVFELYADGKKTGKRAEASEENGWKYEFLDLQRTIDGKPNGKEIAYKVKEVAVKGYEVSQKGNDFINKHVPKTIDIKVTKEWLDEEDYDGLRPDNIKIVLLADGNEVESKILTKADAWKCTFRNLNQYEAGKEIEYTVVEEPVKEYTSKIEGDVKDGFVIKNIHLVKKPEPKKPEPPAPSKPDKPTEKPAINKSPNTADLSNIFIFMVIGSTAMLLLLAAFFTKKFQLKNNK